MPLNTYDDPHSGFSASLERIVSKMSWHQISNKKYRVTIFWAILVFFVAGLLTLGHQQSIPFPALNSFRSQNANPKITQLDRHIQEIKQIAEWTPPPGMKVVALIFYGRRRFVSILDCYLKVRTPNALKFCAKCTADTKMQRNLAVNGGLLDEVVFVAKTEVQEDLDFLDELLASEPKYYSVHRVNSTGGDYSKMYSVCERGNVYVKIDDDILFIDDSTIRSIVKRKVEHPEFYIVSANVVVNFAVAWVHYHLGAIHPYLPDLSSWTSPPNDWRPSRLPSWTGPDDFNWTTWKAPEHTRWLPIKMDGNHSNQMDNTPMALSRYDGVDWIT